MSSPRREDKEEQPSSSASSSPQSDGYSSVTTYISDSEGSTSVLELALHFDKAAGSASYKKKVLKSGAGRQFARRALRLAGLEPENQGLDNAGREVINHPSTSDYIQPFLGFAKKEDEEDIETEEERPVSDTEANNSMAEAMKVEEIVQDVNSFITEWNDHRQTVLAMIKAEACTTRVSVELQDMVDVYNEIGEKMNEMGDLTPPKDPLSASKRRWKDTHAWLKKKHESTLKGFNDYLTSERAPEGAARPEE